MGKVHDNKSTKAPAGSPDILTAEELEQVSPEGIARRLAFLEQGEPPTAEERAELDRWLKRRKAEREADRQLHAEREALIRKILGE